MDTIPFAEEKCNTQPCSEVPEPTTEAPLVEVCEDVEVDDDGEEEEATEPSTSSTATTTEEPKQDAKDEDEPTTVANLEDASGATEVPSESLTVGMSAEGSGDMPSESVSFLF